MPNQIAIEGSVVRLEGITIQTMDVAQYLSQKPQGERVPALIRAVEVGVYCLQRAEVGQSLDFVKLEIERLIQASRTAVDQLPESIREKLAATDGPTAQVSAAAAAAQTAIQDKLVEVRQLFERHLDPAKPDATLGRALSTLTNLLDPKREDSVQKRVDLTLQGIAVADGAIAKAVRATVETAIAPLQTAIETFSLALKKEEGIEEALATTTRKGFAFEDELLPELQRWAAIVGADLEYTAPQNPSRRFHADAERQIHWRDAAQDRGRGTGPRPTLRESACRGANKCHTRPVAGQLWNLRQQDSERARGGDRRLVRA